MINDVLCLIDDSKLSGTGGIKQEFLTKTGFEGVKWTFTGVNTLLILKQNLPDFSHEPY
ncbi:hypothetical protein H1R81_20785 [Emticicia sp. BO119]|nr:hypothetical protein [Emticicia sp. BO119]